MAKDGTTRGGRRVRSGTKPEPLVDKIQKGRSARVMEFPVNDLPIDDDMGYVADLDGADMPEPSAYLSAMQRDGQPLGADIIYRETMRWLKERGCDRLVNNRLVESYSEAFARYIQRSEAVSSYWYLTELAAKCTARRMAPDYISAKIMRQLKNGDVYTCMGCRAFLTPDILAQSPPTAVRKSSCSTVTQNSRYTLN